MSWLSSIGDAIGSGFKSVGSALSSVGKTAFNVVKASVVPLASFAAGLVPGVGPLLSKGVDMLGNSLMGGSGGSAEAVAEEAPSVTDYLVRPMAAQVMSLGNSPAAQALASATSPEKTGFFGKITGSLAAITGIGDGRPGVFGIGDGRPGVLGIGTGKAKAKQEAAEIARKQAEDAAFGEGLTGKAVTLAGDAAAAKAEAKVEKQYNEDGTPASSGAGGGIALVIAAALALFL